LRKVMLLAAMLAMVLAAAAPVLAQTGGFSPSATATTETGDATATQYAAICQNVFDEINAAGVQYAGSFNEVEAEAEDGDDGNGDNGNGDDGTDVSADFTQDVAADLGVSVEVVNECIAIFGNEVNIAAAAAPAPTVAPTAPPVAYPKTVAPKKAKAPVAKKGWYGTATASSGGGSGSYGGSSGGGSGSYGGSSGGGSGSYGGSSGGGSGSYGGSSGGTLPATGGPGGPGALALGAGALLVAGGLLARRLLR